MQERQLILLEGHEIRRRITLDPEVKRIGRLHVERARRALCGNDTTLDHPSTASMATMSPIDSNTGDLLTHSS